MALDYAHQRRDAFTNKPLNLVHQDISPSNIMISRYGGVKLIDFGIASVRRHQSQRKDNKLRGKIPYMAPEQLLMGNHPDQRSDLFSLGLVLYEALTAERLFSAQEEVIAAGKNPKLFRKTIKSKRLPGALAKIILKALEIDISRRYQTANHMYIDLLQYLISCNETGELMDQLADFMGQLFDHTTFPTPTTNFTRPAPYGSPAPTPNESESFSANSNSSSFWDSSDDDIEFPNVTLDLDQPLVPTMNINTQFQTISTIELDEADDDLKTVIDVMRASGKNNRRKVFQGTAAFLTIFLVFAGFDTFNRWTSLGMGIYDWLFPPAIEIITVPTRASLSLDGQKHKSLTPLSIDQISPGVHKLELELAGYKPIIKSLFVPREGQIRVHGESSLSDNRSYLFRFTTEVQITSNPPGAYVFINGIRFNQQTPCRVAWEVGSPFNLELDHPAFGRISDLALNTIEGIIETNDRRFWDMNVLVDSYKKYQVQGIFRKDIAFETVPSGAEIFDTESGTRLGVTGSGRTISLAVGEHELEFRKESLIPERRKVVIDENTRNNQTPVALSRRIRFGAQAVASADRSDIGATLVEFRSGNGTINGRSQKTPFEVTLPAQPYTAVFEKEGYQKQVVRISGETRAVNVTMEPTRSVVEVHVIDALTDLPISGAEIFYGLDDENAVVGSLLGRSDLNGFASGRLLAGKYIVEVKKDGYGTANKNVLTRRGETHNFVIELYPVN
jgi:serine/threonine protein kinase